VAYEWLFRARGIIGSLWSFGIISCGFDVSKREDVEFNRRLIAR
jgi:hypothetical protein